MRHVRAGQQPAHAVVAGIPRALRLAQLDVNLNSLQASVIPDGLRSRVAGAYATVNYGIRPLGALTGGLLADLIGLRPTVTVAAVGGALSLLWLLPSPIPRARSLDAVAARSD